jgi:chemotaxis protein CheZ
MSDAADDLEALFDEIAAQRSEPPPAAAANAGQDQAAEPVEPVEPHTAAAPEGAVDDAADDAEDKAANPMYERLGAIVRMLHDSLRELGYDRSLSSVASQITDAQGRLEHIAALTEQAANKVLNTVDTCMPAQETLGKQAKAIEQRWAQLFDGRLSVDEFKALAGDSKEFAAAVVGASDAEKARLLDIMMAQDFQDITGQLIKKIVAITSTAEKELAQLLRDNAPPEIKAAMAADAKPEALMQGPSAPGTGMAQGDVDSLLAELGF